MIVIESKIPTVSYNYKIILTVSCRRELRRPVKLLHVTVGSFRKIRNDQLVIVRARRSVERIYHALKAPRTRRHNACPCILGMGCTCRGPHKEVGSHVYECSLTIAKTLAKVRSLKSRISFREIHPYFNSFNGYFHTWLLRVTVLQDISQQEISKVNWIKYGWYKYKNSQLRLTFALYRLPLRFFTKFDTFVRLYKLWCKSTEKRIRDDGYLPECFRVLRAGA